ncbi:MAG: polymer-forming cytoskeletal protein [Vicinamibacterales bacterium]
MAAAVVLQAPLRGQVPATGAAPARPDNFYQAGNRVDITQPLEGDAVVAGRTVTIGQPVGGDILAAGWDVTLAAAARDDVRMAGGTVRLDATVAGDTTLAGGDVELGPNTHLMGRTWLTGDRVRVSGRVDRDLHVAARVVQLAGDVEGPIEVVAEEFEILPGARTRGPITYRGRTPATVASGATLAQPVAFERIEADEARRARAWPGVSTFLFSVHLLAVGLLLLYLLPRFEPSMIATLRRHPGRSAIVGFVLLAAAPAVAAALMLSVLALPLGLALAMCYVMALFVAVLATAFFIGDLEARLVKAGPMTTRGQQALLLLAGVVTLALLRLLLGGVVVFAAMLLGLGALSIAAYQALSHADTPGGVPA